MFDSKVGSVVSFHAAVISSVTADISPLITLKMIPFVKIKIEFLFESLHAIPIIYLHSFITDSKD